MREEVGVCPWRAKMQERLVAKSTERQRESAGFRSPFCLLVYTLRTNIKTLRNIINDRFAPDGLHRFNELFTHLLLNLIYNAM